MIDYERAHVDIVSHFNLLNVQVKRLERIAAHNPKDEKAKMLAERFKNLASKCYGQTKEIYGKFK